ncbi:MAG: glycosyltransferase family 9 protein [Sulfuricurvum sp.]|nr:glycosyltransferase family 9 protein [Sulfuricurvum sp.]
MNWKGRILKLFGSKNNRRQFDPKQVKRVLVIRNARIGDAVCAFPLLRELKKAYPEWGIDVYAGRHSDFLFRKLPYVSRVYIKYKKREFFKTWVELIKMKRRKYDLIINAMPLKFDREITTFWMNPQWAIGLGMSKDDKQYGIFRDDLTFYDSVKEFVHGEHMVDYLCGMLPLIGIDNYDTQMEFPFSEKESLTAGAFIHALPDQQIIGLNVDASSVKRNLYEEQILQIVRQLKNQTVVLLSLPSRRTELEKMIQDHQLSNCLLSYQTDTIFDAAELIRRLDLLISPDTSVIHIASALDIPTVGIYRNDEQHIALWGPRSKQHVVIKSSVLDDNSLEGFDTEQTVDKSLELLKNNKTGFFHDV